MGVNCSDSGLKAMSNVVQNDGLAVIHTVDGIWKVKHFPIAVVHARQRPLSLLERFVLKALIQVQGCTVEDLVAQFGLERGLVESTLRVIKHCRLVDLEDVSGEDDGRRRVRAQPVGLQRCGLFEALCLHREHLRAVRLLRLTDDTR